MIRQLTDAHALLLLLPRVKGIIGTIHGAWAGTKIILLGILPRGTDYWDGGSGETAWPNVLTPAINSVNNALKVSRDLYTVYVRQDLHFTGLSFIWWRESQDRAGWRAAIERLLQCT